MPVQLDELEATPTLAYARWSYAREKYPDDERLIRMRAEGFDRLIAGIRNETVGRVLDIHRPVRNYTSGSTVPNHVPSYETVCDECKRLYPCPTVQACGSDGP